jgi:alpha-beta hydrolase superfamily lysophospholipase
MIERGQLDFHPQPLVMFTWKPDDHAIPIKGVIAALHGFAAHARLAFHYLGPALAKRGWIVIAPDLPGLGNWPEPRGMPCHWKLVPAALAALVRKAHELAGEKPVVLLGSSLGGLACIDYVLHHEACIGENAGPVAAVVGLVPTIGTPAIPWYLMALAGIAALIAPRARVGLKKYARLDSHDPDSIILHPDPDPDPLVLVKVSIGYLAGVFLTMRKAGIKNHGQSRWDARVPIYMLSAGNDNQVNPAHVKEFHDGLPAGTIRTLRHRANDYHGVLYESDRDEIFEDIDDFLVESLHLQNEKK